MIIQPMTNICKTAFFWCMQGSNFLEHDRFYNNLSNSLVSEALLVFKNNSKLFIVKGIWFFKTNIAVLILKSEL